MYLSKQLEHTAAIFAIQTTTRGEQISSNFKLQQVPKELDLVFCVYVTSRQHTQKELAKMLN